MSAVRALERMMKTYWKEMVLIGLHVHVGGGCMKTVQKTACKIIVVMIASVLCVLIYLLCLFRIARHTTFLVHIHVYIEFTVHV